jgi:DNA primase
LAPDEWRGLHRRATKEGFSDRELEEAGLLVRQTGKTYDRFRGRLMFPLVDHRGRVVGFGGRTLKDENPKYLNSRRVLSTRKATSCTGCTRPGGLSRRPTR